MCTATRGNFSVYFRHLVATIVNDPIKREANLFPKTEIVIFVGRLSVFGRTCSPTS